MSNESGTEGSAAPAVTKKYALMQRSAPIELPISAIVTPSSARTNDGGVRGELLSIYESYAALYPNPELSQENQERDRLLRAAQAADHAVQLNPKKQKKKGWFGFGGAARDEKETEAKMKKDIYNQDDDDRLTYTEQQPNSDSSGDGDWLLGTEFSLDTSNIPPDAHAQARRQLANHPTQQQQQQPNVARTAWERAGTSCIVVTDLGTVVEFPLKQGGDANGRVQHTSDRALLVRYLEQQQQQTVGEQALPYSIAQARVAIVGPNLLIVSWGLPNDGHVVFYRRVATEDNSKDAAAANRNSASIIVAWEAWACVGPTQDVQDSLGDVFMEENNSAALLAISDLEPLIVEVPNQPPCASLAVARLGGFLELVPLPTAMWYGAALKPAQRRKQPRKFNKNSREHYAAQLTNLAAVNNPRSGGGNNILALTTSEYHVDVIGLGAFRTTVDDVAVWNQDLYPNGPPAEHVLVAHGRQEATGHEAMTFWSVSTVMDESAGASTAGGGTGFTLHASLTEALDLGKAGPDVSLFASPAILRHWRRPRQVELRMPTESSEPPSPPRVTTLSVSAPLVRVHFRVDYNGATGGSPTIRAALQDWNGGVTIIDCDMLEKAVAQTLSEEEYASIYNSAEEDEMVVPLVKIIQDRSRSMQQLLCSSKSKNQRQLSLTNLPLQSLEWFEKKVSSSESTDNVALAALTGDPCTLRLVFSSLFHQSPDSVHNNDEGPPSFDTITVDCSSNIAGTLRRLGFGMKNLYLALQSARNEKQVLMFCSLQELGPKEIVAWLVKDHKLREAIATSQSLSTAEYESISDHIEGCKKQLWESEQDFTALEAVKDDAYIIKVALYSPPDNSEQAIPLRNMDVGLFRSVCRLALKRIQKARLGSSLVFAGTVEKVHKVTEDITDRLVRVGTYELLCQYLSCEPSLDQFIQHYLQTPTIDLAMSFAKSGDITPLTLLFLRHRRDFFCHELNILDQIPLSVSPIFYQHLLPVQQESSTFDIDPSLFLAGAKSELLLHISSLPQYIDERFEFSAAVDEDDEKLVVENCAKQATDETGNGSSNKSKVLALDEWYAKRADSIDKFLSSLELSASFSKLALCALRFGYPADAFGTSEASRAIRKLCRIATFADTLRTVLPDPNDTKLLSSLTSLGPDGFADLAAKDLVAVVMNCEGESVDLKSRYDQFLLPMLKERFSGIQDDSVFHLEVDRAVQSFCLSLFDEGEVCTATALLDAVKLCSKVARLSRTSLEQGSRIIKGKYVLINLVLLIFKNVSEALSALQLGIADQPEIVNALWLMYESLPAELPQNGNSEEQSELKAGIDSMFNHLVFLDLLVHWPISNAFVMLHDRVTILSEDEDRAAPKHICLGDKAISILCQVFCDQLREVREAGSQSKAPRGAVELLTALLNDLNQMNSLCFECCLSRREVLTKWLFRPLLLQHEIALLGEFLARADREVLDTDSIAKEVSIFFNDAVHGTQRSDGGGKSRLSAAMECQDLLGKYFPELRREFEAVRRYLDAAHHINTILLPNATKKFDPEEIRGMFPLDVVDGVLAANPHAIICDCEEWADRAWAKNANEIIRNHIFNSSRRTPDEVAIQESIRLPPLPGQAVFHLAKLLAMEKAASAIAVKSRAIECAVDAGLAGAAAALGRSLIADASASRADALPVLDAIAKIASQEEYEDVTTKRELCSLVLVQHTGQLTPVKNKALEVILNIWNKIEHHDRVAERPLKGPMVSTRQFFYDTKEEYAMDIRNLFTTLHCQLTDCVVDDLLLNALARYAAFWCIGRTTRPRTHPIGSLEPPSTASIIALATSLLLHIRNADVSGPCLEELRHVFDEQKQHVANLTASGVQFVVPDPAIVRKLMGRGYSEFGARRAAIRTSNAGFDPALQWAVLHSLDNDFDEPLACVRFPSERFADKESKEILDTCIELLEKIQSGEVPLENLFLGGVSTGPADREEEEDSGWVETKLLAPANDLHEANGSRSLSMNHASLTRSDPRSVAAATEASHLPTTSETVANEKTSYTAKKPPAEKSHSNNKLNVAGLKIPASIPKKVPGLTVAPGHSIKGKLMMPGSGKLKVPSGTGKLKVPGSGKEKAPAGVTVVQKDTASIQTQETGSPATGAPSAPDTMLAADPSTNTTDAPSRHFVETTGSTPPPPPPESEIPGAQPPLTNSSEVPITNGNPAQSETTVVPSPTASTSVASRLTRNVVPPRRERLEINTRIPPSGSPDRSSLLELGQAVFRSARHASPSRLEERRRLMEQGRLLLQKTRSVDQGSPAKRPPTMALPAPAPKPPPTPPARAPPEVDAKPPNNDKSDDQWNFDEDDFDI